MMAGCGLKKMFGHIFIKIIPGIGYTSLQAEVVPSIFYDYASSSYIELEIKGLINHYKSSFSENI